MGKQGDRKVRKQRRLEMERHRREASGNGDPGPEAFGIKLPSPVTGSTSATASTSPKSSGTASRLCIPMAHMG